MIGCGIEEQEKLSVEKTAVTERANRAYYRSGLNEHAFSARFKVEHEVREKCATDRMFRERHLLRQNRQLKKLMLFPAKNDQASVSRSRSVQPNQEPKATEPELPDRKKGREYCSSLEFKTHSYKQCTSKLIRLQEHAGQNVARGRRFIRQCELVKTEEASAREGV